MKKFTFLIFGLFAFTQTTLFAQQISNAGFEVWESTEKATGWDGSNIHTTYLGFPVNVVTTTQDNTNQHSGTYCIKTTSKQIMTGFPVNPGFFTLGTFWFTISPQNGGAKGGIPFVGRPDSLVGYYKGTLMGNDKFTFFFESWKGNHTTSVGHDTLLIASSTNSYNRFAQKINYSDSSTPDSMNIVISSSDMFTQANITANSVLYVDDLSLIYGSVSVLDINFNNNFNVYADASDVIVDLKFEKETKTDISIFNYAGQLLYNKTVRSTASQEKFSLNNFSKGAFVIFVTTDSNKKFSQKIIIN
ncbi:MAG: T9SS type A sorting domain-containing protein [Bacteroidia bacterium]|nr:T9SS type A sorting domain-containing protein [Bacteroidia bacterium]